MKIIIIKKKYLPETHKTGNGRIHMIRIEKCTYQKNKDINNNNNIIIIECYREMAIVEK